MPTTWRVTERPERSLSQAAVRNNLLYAVRERKYKREFNVFASTSRVTLGEVSTAVDSVTGLAIPQIGASYPSDSLAICIKVDPVSTSDRRSYFRVTCEYDTSWIVNAITDNPLNQLPEISWSGPGYERALRRDAFGITVQNSAGYAFDPTVTIDDKRALVRIVRNEATFNETYARLWRKKLNKNTFAGSPPLQSRINTIDATRQLSNGVLFFQVMYEIESREFPDAFISYTQDMGYFDKNQVAFPDPFTGMPLGSPTPLNGRGGNLFLSKMKNEFGAIDATQTTITVPYAKLRALFPPDKKAPNVDGIILGPDWDYQIRIDDEIMNVTATDASGVGPQWWELTVERGYAGTISATHAVNAEISLEPYFLRFIGHKYADFALLGLPII